MPSAQWRPPGPRARPAAPLPQARASRCRARRAPPGPARASSAAPPAARGAERGPPEWRRSPSSEQHPKPSSSLCWSPRSELRPPPAPGSAANQEPRGRRRWGAGASRPPRTPAAPLPRLPALRPLRARVRGGRACGQALHSESGRCVPASRHPRELVSSRPGSGNRPWSVSLDTR